MTLDIFVEDDIESGADSQSGMGYSPIGNGVVPNPDWDSSQNLQRLQPETTKTEITKQILAKREGGIISMDDVEQEAARWEDAAGDFHRRLWELYQEDFGEIGLMDHAWMGVWRQTLYWSQCYEGQIHSDHAPVVFGMVRKSQNPKRPMGLLSDMLHKYMRQTFNYGLDLAKPPRESLRDQHSRRRGQGVTGHRESLV